MKKKFTKDSNALWHTDEQWNQKNEQNEHKTL